VPGLTGLLVANRGEIAVRILSAAADLGIRTVAVHSEDDARSLHLRRADAVRPLRGTGPAAYLDVEQLVETAVTAGCDAIHPGYGFLSEVPAFAARCAEAGLRFVGPRAEVLALFGDKSAGRALAARCGVPVLAGTTGATSLDDAVAFMTAQPGGGAVMVKALAGGGGRGMRVVRRVEELAEAFERCRSESLGAFGNGDLLVEAFLPRARHVEVQVVGDGSGAVTHLWERECSLQRRHQKLVEVAPSPSLSAGQREAILAAALRMAGEVTFDNIGTFEFLVDADADADTDSDADGPGFVFIEANPRLQVEHTVTEEVTGVDLVQTQLRLAAGASLAEVGLSPGDVPSPRGYALQARVNTEMMAADGTTRPAGGTLGAFEPPSGPGVRVDTCGYAGYTTNPRFDSLLAKLIVHSPSPAFADVVTKASRSLREFRIEGLATNIAFLQSLLQRPEVIAADMTTRFVDDRAAELVGSAIEDRRFFVDAPPEAAAGRRAGAQIDNRDPLAVLDHGKSASPSSASFSSSAGSVTAGPVAPAYGAAQGVEGTIGVLAPMQGTIVGIDVDPGDAVHAGQQLLVMEAMKMEHVVAADRSGFVRGVDVAVGDTVFEGHLLVEIEEADIEATADVAEDEVDLDHIRPDLEEVVARHAIGLDPARPESVARRRRTGQRTTRENVDDLCDPGSFVEYGPLVIAGQRRRRTVEDLIEHTPADGMVSGIGTVNADLFGARDARCVVMSYDYTVLAGTQGLQNHRKKDRMFELAERWRLPVVFFTEGGGGRPGDTDGAGVFGLDTMAFHLFGRLSGHVPLVGITSGRCFAGNAALLGCCDVVIATEGSNIGMGGPAMIEGGGLGIFRPEEVGPLDVQVANGVVDLPVADEAEAVAVAKRYLSYFQGPLTEWECADQRRLRRCVPENRLRVYDVRQIV
jgi:acetyl/propionyl-CoA carboxylase alpha subunit/acetyl-CoA carboxylase beta subunit